MTDFVKMEVTDGVATLVLNSPATRNALAHDEQYAAIEQACRAISRDRDIRCAILTGAGPAFCAGGDIKAMVGRINDPDLEPIQDRYHYKEGIHRIPLAIYH